MKKNATKALSLALSLAMVSSMVAVPSMAAGTHWITASLDGREVYNESFPDRASVGTVDLIDDLGVGVDVKVTVNDEAFTTARPVYMTGTLDNGTVYRLAENDDRSLSLTTTNNRLNDDINVSVERVARDYTVTANSGPSGFKGDLGSDSNPSCVSGGGVSKVEGNTAWTTTFTPVNGQVIKSLNIRTSASGRNVIPADAGTVTVGSTKLSISRNGDSVTVRADQVANNLYVTALTAERVAQHELSVVTVGDVTSSVVSTLIEAGTSKDVVLTPGEASIVDTIEINDGGKVGTITTDRNSVSVNGHTYRVTRALNGKTTVSVPSMAADVVITATATSNKAGLSISTPSDVICNLPTQSYPEKGSAVDVRLTPRDNAEITSIKIQSPTDSVILNSNEYRFILDGKVYRVDTRYDSSRVLYFDSFPGNVQISVNSKETRHTITLDADRGCDYDGSSDKLRVDDGGSKTFSFIALDGEEIERLVFKVDGVQHTVNRDDSYIRIDGVRCPITWETGRVTVSLYEVTNSMTVKAYTTAYDEDYVIRVDHDGGASTTNSRVYANYGNSKTITFTERKGYEIERIDVTVKGKTYSAYRGDTNINIDGRRCPLSWTSTKASITLNSIRADMDVYCDTDYDGVTTTKPTDGDYVVTLYADDGCSYSGSKQQGVKTGDSKTVSFTAESGSKLESLVITYLGKDYVVDRGTSSVTIDGNRCNVTWSGSTRVSIILRDVRGDVTVEAISNYKGTTSSSKTLTRRAGAHTKIELDPNSATIRPKDGITVTIVPDSGYVVDTVEFKYANSNKGVTITNGTSEFLLNNKVYSVSWGADGSAKVYFDSLANNMTVTSTAKQVQVVTPVEPVQPVQPSQPQGSVYHMAYVSGEGNGMFAPDRAITRAEALTILLRAYQNTDNMNMTGTVAAPFLDVSPSSWYYNYVTYAYNQGLLAGLHNVGPATFRPDAPITRAEFVELATRFMGVTNYTPTATRFEDVLAGHWASGVISFATAQGWISGYPDGRFAPEGQLTRAELVSITNRALGRSASRSYLDASVSGLTTFTDVGPAHWAYYDILEAANAHYCNIVNGVEQWTR